MQIGLESLNLGSFPPEEQRKRSLQLHTGPMPQPSTGYHPCWSSLGMGSHAWNVIPWLCAMLG